jgi:hypothetical protein
MDDRAQLSVAHSLDRTSVAGHASSAQHRGSAASHRSDPRDRVLIGARPHDNVELLASAFRSAEVHLDGVGNQRPPVRRIVEADPGERVDAQSTLWRGGRDEHGVELDAPWQEGDTLLRYDWLPLRELQCVASPGTPVVRTWPRAFRAARHQHDEQQQGGTARVAPPVQRRVRCRPAGYRALPTDVASRSSWPGSPPTYARSAAPHPPGARRR